MKFIIFGLSVALMALVPFSTSQAQQSSSKATSNLKTVVLPVEGMSCLSCVAGIKKSLKNTLGITSVEVNLKDRNTKVVYVDGLTSIEVISKKITELGYKVGKPIEELK